MRIRCIAFCAVNMANSRFQYVKKFELPDVLLQDTYLVTRLDGHRFTKFTAEHGFTKPNDERGLLLMAEVMSEWSDVVMAYGQSDEFSFLLPASSSLYGRRSAKISTSFVSLFSSSFVFFWPKYFPDTPLLYPPNFDARVVSYPTAEHIRDYFGWRQADCHINNLYNTCFWALVASGETKQEAQVILKGTTSGDKNELLFSRFGTNYNEISQRFRKGTTLYRARPGSSATTAPQGDETLHHDTSERRGIFGGRALEYRDEMVDPGAAVAPDGSRLSSSVASCVDGDARGEPEPNLSPSAESDEVDRVAESATGYDRGAIEDVSRTSEESTSTQEGPDSVPTMFIGGPAASQPLEATVGHGKGDGVAKVIDESGISGRAKRLVKKGHAPPGFVEEDVCDIIRDDFWDRNSHILAGVERRR